MVGRLSGLREYRQLSRLISARFRPGRNVTQEQFSQALTKLRLSVYASAKVFGISLRQSQRYSSGEQVVSGPVANHLTSLVSMMARWKKQRHKDLDQSALFEDKSARPRLRADGRDVKLGQPALRTGGRVGGLLRSPVGGLPSQID